MRKNLTDKFSTGRKGTVTKDVNPCRNKIKIIWLILSALYLIYIGIMTYLYPFTVDEMVSFDSVYGIIEKHNALLNPRIWTFVGSILLYAGKWLFVTLNPFIQLGIVTGVFYFVYLRLPRTDEFKDLPFIIVSVFLSLFAVAQPDNTLFWLGGATNYSWPFLFFILFLCLMRSLLNGKTVFKNKIPVYLLMLIFGFALGMANENNSPMALLLSAVFIITARVKKIKIPSWFYFLAAAICSGVVLLFVSPESYERLSLPVFRTFREASLYQKLFWHMWHMDNMMRLNFYLAPLTLVSLVITAVDREKHALGNKNFRLSLFSLICAFILSFVLFMAPIFNETRAFYSSTVMYIISFLAFVKYITETYNFNFLLALSLLCSVASFYFFPPYVKQYTYLHGQETKRIETIKEAEARGEKSVFLEAYSYKKGISKNLTVLFFEPLLRPADMMKYYGIEIKDNYNRSGIYKLIKTMRERDSRESRGADR